MKYGVCSLTCLDQEKEMIGFISIREHGREVKSFDRVPDLLSPAEGDALGDVACKRGLDIDGLCHDQNKLVVKGHGSVHLTLEAS
jgi:hypothetical protein